MSPSNFQGNNRKLFAPVRILQDSSTQIVECSNQPIGNDVERVWIRGTLIQMRNSAIGQPALN